MSIFETKSKYFENNNSKFAHRFSSASVTIVLILVGIVGLAIGIHMYLESTTEAKLVKNTKKWLTDYGFIYKDLKFQWVHNEDEGTTKSNIRYLFSVSEIQHAKLNGGHPIVARNNSIDLTVTAESHSDAALAVRNIGLAWFSKKKYPDDRWYDVEVSFTDWFVYQLHPETELIFTKYSMCLPPSNDEILNPVVVDTQSTGVPSLGTIPEAPVASESESEPEPSQSEGIQSFVNDLKSNVTVKDTQTAVQDTQTMVQNQNYVLPPKEGTKSWRM